MGVCWQWDIVQHWGTVDNGDTVQYWAWVWFPQMSQWAWQTACRFLNVWCNYLCLWCQPGMFPEESSSSLWFPTHLLWCNEVFSGCHLYQYVRGYQCFSDCLYIHHQGLMWWVMQLFIIYWRICGPCSPCLCLTGKQQWNTHYPLIPDNGGNVQSLKCWELIP
jgi:hypothetical protein